MASFHLFECNSPVSALLLLYEAYYSREFQMNNKIMDNFRMFNLIDLASSSMKQAFSFKKTGFMKSKSLSQLLMFKRRVAGLQSQLKKAAESKIELYSQLSLDNINCSTLFQRGNDTFELQESCKREINSLLRISNKDFFLVKRGIFLEKFLYEKQMISPALSKALDEVVLEHQVPKDLDFTVETTKHKINFFSADHAVVMVSCAGPPFKIAHVSGNYRDIFEASESELVGSHIDQYMPECISRLHDRYVLNYLNGKENLGDTSYIASCVKTASRFISLENQLESVHLIIRLEYNTFGDLYLGALVIKRGKSKNPVIYTENNGNIIGCNNEV